MPGIWNVLVLVACSKPTVGQVGLVPVPEDRPTDNELRAGCLASTVTRWEAVGTGAGELPVATTLEERYDDLGWQIGAVFQQDGEPPAWAVEWARRDDGQYESWLLDFGDNGEPEHTELFVFGEDDLADTRQLDLGTDGAIEELSEYVNLDGVRAEERLDEYGDGVFDALLSYTWDELGRVVEVARDDGLDGTVDSIASWEWLDDTDRLVSYDDGVGGLYEEHEYDDAGRVLRSYWSGSDRNSWDAQEIEYTYVGDAARPDAGASTTWYGSGLIESASLTLSWDADGRPLEVRYDYAPSATEPVDRVQIVTTEWLCAP